MAALSDEIEHYRAFLEYCKYVSRKEIADKFGVTIDTINNWSSKEKWRENRAKLERARAERNIQDRADRQQKLEDTIFQKYVDKSQQITNYLLDHILLASRILAEEQILYFEGKKSKRNLTKQKELNEVGRVIAGTLRNTLPQFQEELAERMISELENLHADSL